MNLGPEALQDYRFIALCCALVFLSHFLSSSILLYPLSSFNVKMIWRQKIRNGNLSEYAIWDFGIMSLYFPRLTCFFPPDLSFCPFLSFFWKLIEVGIKCRHRHISMEHYYWRHFYAKDTCEIIFVLSVKCFLLLNFYWITSKTTNCHRYQWEVYAQDRRKQTNYELS